MACQWRHDHARCADHECPLRAGGGPCDGHSYAPATLDDGAPRYTLTPAIVEQRMLDHMKRIEEFDSRARPVLDSGRD